MRDEPRRHPVYMLLLAVAAVGTVPIFFVGAPAWSWLGLPVWLWSSAGFTLVLSCLIAWGVLRYWPDEDDGA